ncbi:MAG: HU family DNA-binding protein [Leptospirales bacterium]
MNRADIVERVLNNREMSQSFSRKQVREALDFALEEIAAELLDGKSVKLTDFGTFEPRVRKDRMGRNPKTGEKLLIKSHSVIVFRPTKNFWEKVEK